MYELTPEKIAELKAKYGKFYFIKVEGKAAVFRAPNRKELSYASLAGAKDPMKFNESIMNSCFVEGDKELINDDDYFLGTSQQIANIIEVKESSMEKY